MYKRIAVAIDHSECSPHALEQALALAAAEQSEVVLISVVPAYQGDLRLMGDSSILESMRQPYQQALEDAAQKAAGQKVAFKTLLLSGEPGEEILQAVEQEKADLVVLGKKVSRLRDLIPIGSVSAKLLKLSPVDVLIIPCGKPLDFNTIMVAYDGSSHAGKAARHACLLGARYGSTYLLTTIYEMSLEAYAFSPGISRKLHDEAAKRQEPIVRMLNQQEYRQYQCLVEHGDPVYRALIELAKRKAVGLAVLGSRGAGNISKILLGSVAARFISSGICPTLVVK